MKATLIAAVAVLQVVVTARGAGAQATIGGEWRSDVAAAARAIVDVGLSPGMGVAVTVGDWVAYADGFGTADAVSGRAVTGDTPFYIASTTKSLTALAMVLAAQRGDVDLNAPMTRYLPQAKLAPGIDRGTITVHDLIALTHGLSGDGPVVLRTAYSGEFTRTQLLDLLQHHAATGAHGTFSYNNLGFNLAGLVLEAVYDEPWQDIVERLVIEPIGMHDTNARLSRMDRDAVAQPHGGAPDGWSRLPLGKEDANMHAAGGHFASARDMARYLAVHIGEGTIDGARVLPAAAIRATHQLRASQNRRFGPYQRFGWAYGWDLGTYSSDTLIHRFGGFTGYRSHVSFMPQHDVGVVVLVNGEGPASAAADLLATHIYDLLLNRPGTRASFGARLDSMMSQLPGYRSGLAQHLAERRARLAPLPHPLDHFAGTYTNARLGTMVLRVVGGGLEVRVGVQQSRAEVYNAADNALRIEVGGGGQVAQFTFPQGGGPARAVRLGDQEFVRVPER